MWSVFADPVTINIFIVGFRVFRCEVDKEDLQFCTQYVKRKPRSVPAEFTDLAQILMTENNWPEPQSTYECLQLYLNLKGAIEEGLELP